MPINAKTDAFLRVMAGVYTLRLPSKSPSQPHLRCRDNGMMATTTTPNRSGLVRRGQWLEYFTIGYNSLEGLVSIVAGWIAGSVSLIGFGLDNLIDVASGAALLWRLHEDLNESRREQVERSTLR